jgi:hypothetical protein
VKLEFGPDEWPTADSCPTCGPGSVWLPVAYQRQEGEWHGRPERKPTEPDEGFLGFYTCDRGHSWVASYDARIGIAAGDRIRRGIAEGTWNVPVRAGELPPRYEGRPASEHEWDIPVDGWTFVRWSQLTRPERN